MNDPTSSAGQQAEGLRFEPAKVKGFVTYRGPVPFDQLSFPDELNNGDFQWAFNDPEVQRQYGGLVVAVAGRKVWGAGKTYRAAREDAHKDPSNPPPDDLVFVPVSTPPSETEEPGGNPSG